MVKHPNLWSTTHMNDILPDVLLGLSLVSLWVFIIWTLIMAFRKSFWTGVLCIIFGVALIAFCCEDIKRRWKPLAFFVLFLACIIGRGAMLKNG